MTFIDMIKKSVISEFTGTISADKILLSLLTAFVIGIFIVFIYKKTYNGVVYSKSFSLSLILLAMVTALIIRTISSNLALSLGMVGALSIVRFRTAIKEPLDTAFMFWAITAGIMSGAGLYLVSVVASLGLGLFYFVCYVFGFRMNKQYLFVVKYENEAESMIQGQLKKIGKYKVKSKSITKGITELTFEVAMKENDSTELNRFIGKEGVISASIISYQNDFGA